MPLALNALSEAIHLAEPEGYIRSFVDEGAPMKLLLYQLRKRDRGQGSIAYLDTLLAAFQRERMERVQVGGSTKARTLLEFLSEQELQVLALVADGASNVEIAEELAMSVSSVKRHVSHIFTKLGVKNRVQVIRLLFDS